MLESNKDHSGVTSRKAWLVKKCANAASLASVSVGRLGGCC